MKPLSDWTETELRDVISDLFHAVQHLRGLVERIASDEEMDGEADAVLTLAEAAVCKAGRSGLVTGFSSFQFRAN